MTTTRLPGADLAAGRTGEHNLLCLVAKELVASEVCQLTLRDPRGRRLPEWTPGSHIDLVLPNGMVRQYSLCGDRRQADTYRVAVLREPAGRGGSAYVHDELRPGDVVGIGGPRNHFPLVPAQDYLFLAGGIGITPLLPMIQAADLLNIPWRLVYGGRTRASMAFLRDLAVQGHRVKVCPQDETGLLDLDAELAGTGPGTIVYCCGPAPLLTALGERTLAWERGRVRTERFRAPERLSAAADMPFVVDLARSGVSVTVAPGQSILDAVSAVGVSVLSSCRSGMCGTCETKLLAGSADHRDSVLDDASREAGDSIMPCVSRALGDRLVLDL
ncbi:PDR/VanB family oxidoreductase [Streptomyces malaysiensis]|uniref:PDR/VanB family oxidoreductase n=1 Tax=Streptomyces malaysiensis TaxID=92644 RepID=UPI002B2F01BA|nr:PDR/VanB family oxidoreductase [Streptomyces malaysiensis]